MEGDGQIFVADDFRDGQQANLLCHEVADVGLTEGMEVDISADKFLDDLIELNMVRLQKDTTQVVCWPVFGSVISQVVASMSTSRTD